MMINSMGWVEGLGFQLLLHTIRAMRANIVLVVGQDRLFKQLQATYKVSSSLSRCNNGPGYGSLSGLVGTSLCIFSTTCGSCIASYNLAIILHIEYSLAYIPMALRLQPLTMECL